MKYDAREKGRCACGGLIGQKLVGKLLLHPIAIQVRVVCCWGLGAATVLMLECARERARARRDSACGAATLTPEATLAWTIEWVQQMVGLMTPGGVGGGGTCGACGRCCGCG